MFTFDSKLYRFFVELAKNNQRDWFQSNKQRFEQEVQQPLLDYVEAMAKPLKKISPSILAIGKKSGGSLTRIYRDTRFAKDKTPYQNYLMAHFGPTASMQEPSAGFYLRVDAKGLTCGMGMCGDSRAIKLIRQHIDTHQKEFVRARDHRTFTQMYPEGITGESLKRPPQGFDKDHPLLDDLKRKGFFTELTLPKRQATKKDVVEYSMAAFKAAKPLVAFLNRAMNVDF